VALIPVAIPVGHSVGFFQSFEPCAFRSTSCFSGAPVLCCLNPYFPRPLWQIPDSFQEPARAFSGTQIKVFSLSSYLCASVRRISRREGLYGTWLANLSLLRVAPTVESLVVLFVIVGPASPPPTRARFPLGARGFVIQSDVESGLSSVFFYC